MPSFVKTYIFIDAQNFRQAHDEVARAWTGSDVRVEYYAIGMHWNAAKMFYYDCFDETLTGADRERYEEELERIQQVSGAHVRSGWLTGRGKKRRQKGVDVQISVDMMHHAARGNMDHAILFSGDGDFVPLVEALVDMGVTVEVAADHRTAAVELRRAADAFLPFGVADYARFWPNKILKDHPLADRNGGLFAVRRPAWRQLRSARIGSQVKAAIYVSQDERTYVLTVADHEQSEHSTWADGGRAQLFFDLQWGPAQWSADESP